MHDQQGKEIYFTSYMPGNRLSIFSKNPVMIGGRYLYNLETRYLLHRSDFSDLFNKGIQEFGHCRGIPVSAAWSANCRNSSSIWESGIATMMKAQDPALDIQKLAAILNQSAKDVMEAGKDQKRGYGIINAANAYAL